MKRKLFLAVVLTLVAVLSAAAQATITTKKYKIADFQARTMKVVLPGVDWLDEMLRYEVMNTWTLSPFEFCTEAEFDQLRSSDEYYFLVVVSGRFRKEKTPGIDMLTVLKGGDGDLDRMLEIVSLPFAPTAAFTGRESVFLGPLLEVLQDRVGKAIRSDLKGYLGLPSTILLGKDSKMKTIFFAEGDLAANVTAVERHKYFDEEIRVVDEDEADQLMEERSRQMTLVSYVVAPAEPLPGSVCYKMLFDASTHELVYFRRHKISSRRPAGFLVDDIKRIVAVR